MDILAVAMPVYNALPIVQRSVEALLEHTDVDPWRLYLVDNHPPDGADVRTYVRTVAAEHENVEVLDPGRNVGCHDGINYAWERCQAMYLAKIDDDTVMSGQWASRLVRALSTRPDLAYLAADCTAKWSGEELVSQIGDLEYVEPTCHMVGFSCVVVPSHCYQLLGPLKTGAAGSLYGGEEMYYANQAAKYRKKVAYLRGVTAFHQDNEDRPVEYVLWKYCYGFLRHEDLGGTPLPYDEFIEDEDALRAGYTAWLASDNGWLREKAEQWLTSHS